MNATIDIKTLAGQSLKGFPYETPEINCFDLFRGHFVLYTSKGKVLKTKLHKGDKITIEIL